MFHTAYMCSPAQPTCDCPPPCHWSPGISRTLLTSKRTGNWRFQGGGLGILSQSWVKTIILNFSPLLYLLVVSGFVPRHILSARLRSDKTSIVGMITLATRHTTNPIGVETRNMGWAVLTRMVWLLVISKNCISIWEKPGCTTRDMKYCNWGAT